MKHVDHVGQSISLYPKEVYPTYR